MQGAWGRAPREAWFPFGAFCKNAGLFTGRCGVSPLQVGVGGRRSQPQQGGNFLPLLLAKSGKATVSAWDGAVFPGIPD